MVISLSDNKGELNSLLDFLKINYLTVKYNSGGQFSLITYY